MFRAYFMTFHGKFRGWKIVKGWKPPAHEEHHDAHHDAHAADAPLEGPAPRESPPAMTVPLMVLAAFAIVAGFFNASALHQKALEHMGELLDPIFAKASQALAARPADDKLELLMMAPGLLAFAVGGGAAWAVYEQRGGRPERDFARSFPRLYQLIYDKWRIDELYDATVVGMVEALADIFDMADKWVIDGVLARGSAAVVGFAGTVLRAFQTGRVQAYSASMVIGLAGLGWFLVRPHAAVAIDDKALKASGQITLSAAPGLGYRYHWEVKDTAPPPTVELKPSDAAAAAAYGRDFTVTLSPGESKEVVLEVVNAFHSVARQVIPLRRPSPMGIVGPFQAVTAHPGERPRAPSDPAQGGQR
jgi:NADH-quinone oxidoreductase subunit L